MYDGRLEEIPGEIIDYLEARGREGNILTFLRMASAGQMEGHLKEAFATAEKVAGENFEMLSKLLGFTMASDEELEKCSCAAGIAFAMATILTGTSPEYMDPAADLRTYGDAVRAYSRRCKQEGIPFDESLETLVFMLKNMASTVEDAIRFGFSNGRFVLAVDQTRADDLEAVGITRIIEAMQSLSIQLHSKIVMAPGYIAHELKTEGFTPTIYVSAN